MSGVLGRAPQGPRRLERPGGAVDGTVSTCLPQLTRLECGYAHRPAALSCEDLPSGPPSLMRTLRLRPSTASDLQAFNLWALNHHLIQMVDSDLLYAIRTGDGATLEAIQDSEQQLLRIVTLDEIPVGYVRLSSPRTPELAFLETAVLHPGAGVRASRQLIALALDTRGLFRVETRVFTCNIRSLTALRNQGFTEEGTLRLAGWHTISQRRCDLIVFGMLRSEMERVRVPEDL